MPTIIDGYNLIFSCGLEGKTHTPQSLEEARARLVATVATKLYKQERSGTTIVFDAKRLPIKETSADFRAHDIRVLYAVDHEDADTLIEELIAKHSTPKKLTVVSSDHRLQTAATRRKATAIDSDVWWEALSRKSAAPVVETDALDHSQLDSGSVEQEAIEALKSVDWLNEFGEFETGQFENPELPKPGEESNSTQKNTGNSQSETTEDHFNPFPEGYGEDLIDENYD